VESDIKELRLIYLEIVGLEDLNERKMIINMPRF
jgi:hypothetical protein